MIGIRSITYQMPEEYGKHELDVILKASRKWLDIYPLIRTQRLALKPVTNPHDIKKYLELSKLCDMSDIRWFNVPIDPWKAHNKEGLFRFAENLLSSYGRCFVNVLMFKEGKADLDIMELSAALTKKVSHISLNGKDNFRLGLSANIEANAPFFPFTFSAGKSGFSIALELTQEINAICEKYPAISLSDLRERIRTALYEQIKRIELAAAEVEERYGLEFFGFDFSIAPIIDCKGSVIPMLRRLGVQKFGSTGTMFATAFLTDLIKSFTLDFKSVGFSGVMYSLLEDLEMCEINNQHGITLEDLIKVSTMCGCGVDMLPVPNDTAAAEMISIFMEVFAISTRLKKPLGIRLLPIPHCHKNQRVYTNFHDDADFIANTRVVCPDVNTVKNVDEHFSFCVY